MKDRYLDPKADLTIKKVFGELPKFTSHSMSEQKMQWLWLRFMTEIGDNYA